MYFTAGSIPHPCPKRSTNLLSIIVSLLLLDGNIDLDCEIVKGIMDGIYLIVTYYIHFRRYDNIYFIVYTYNKIYRFTVLYAR